MPSASAPTVAPFSATDPQTYNDTRSVTVYDSAISVSTDNGTTYPAGSSPPTFIADGS